MSQSLSDLQWLVSPTAAGAIQIAAELRDPLAAIQKLRRELSVERARLAVEQASLRLQAGRKFSRAMSMYFTRKSLEQATDEVVARYKSKRFSNASEVADLCTGIGGDLIGLAGRTTVDGHDFDPALATLARANAQACDAEVQIYCSDVTQLDLTQWAVWHLDPDRRHNGQRSIALENHQPDLAAIEKMLATNPHAAIKLAPATVLPEGWPSRFELEWISRGRECKQLVAWHGNLAQSQGLRRATALDSTGNLHTFLAKPAGMPAKAHSLGKYLYEPDAAVLAAKLEGALAHHCQLQPIAPGAVYLTSDKLVEMPMLAAFEILACEPWSERRFQSILAELNIGKLEVKKRGVDIEPARVIARMKARGSEAGVLFVTRLDQQMVGIAAKRTGSHLGNIRNF